MDRIVIFYPLDALEKILGEMDRAVVEKCDVRKRIRKECMRRMEEDWWKMEEDWRRIGGGLEEDGGGWRRMEENFSRGRGMKEDRGRLEEDGEEWRRIGRGWRRDGGGWRRMKKDF
ncbi:hypothetical protein HZU73_08043 [Apis mellifera caucasica]|nr:hypothetical protein HZU73_08043 [Apis mellifera caucasica]